MPLRGAGDAAAGARGWCVRAAGDLGYGVGVFMVCYSAVNVAGEVVRPGFDASILCMPLAPTRWWASRLTVAAATALLCVSLARPLRNRAVYATAQSLLLLLMLSASGAALGTVWRALENEVSRALPARYTVLLAAAFASQAVRIWAERRRGGRDARGRRGRYGRAAAVCAAGAAFLGAQFFLFGAARRDVRADCAVVMGAGVLWGGEPGHALAERTRTACDLYLSGRVRRLILSGGPVYGRYTEPVAMRSYAAKLGVPRDAMVLDEEGLSTYDTARNARRIMAARGWRTAVIVTHEYHVSRTWLAFRRAGVDAVGYPARRRGFRWGKDLFAILRECAAWSYYFLLPLWRPLG